MAGRALGRLQVIEWLAAVQHRAASLLSVLQWADACIVALLQRVNTKQQQGRLDSLKKRLGKNMGGSEESATLTPEQERMALFLQRANEQVRWPFGPRSNIRADGFGGFAGLSSPRHGPQVEAGSSEGTKGPDSSFLLAPVSAHRPDRRRSAQLQRQP